MITGDLNWAVNATDRLSVDADGFVTVRSDWLISLLRDNRLLRAALTDACKDLVGTEELLLTKFGAFADASPEVN